MGAEISDILEIRDLAYQYAQAVDRHDSEAFAGAFLDNGVLCGSGYLSEGREQLLRVPQFTAKRWLKTFHAVHNHRIAVDGDKATGEVYCIAHHFREVEGSGHTDHVMVIRYLDDYVRTPNGWRFARRELNVDWTEDRVATPHTPPPPRK
jgi:hypothetical protein